MYSSIYLICFTADNHSKRFPRNHELKREARRATKSCFKSSHKMVSFLALNQVTQYKAPSSIPTTATATFFPGSSNCCSARGTQQIGSSSLNWGSVTTVVGCPLLLPPLLVSQPSFDRLRPCSAAKIHRRTTACLSKIASLVDLQFVNPITLQSRHLSRNESVKSDQIIMNRMSRYVRTCPQR